MHSLFEVKNRWQKTLIGAAAAALLLSLNTGAVAADKHIDGCQAKPDQPSTKEEKAGDGKLSDCDGVLKPPVVGDPELVHPAPKAGNMPVIAPKDLPKAKRDGAAPKDGQVH